MHDQLVEKYSSTHGDHQVVGIVLFVLGFNFGCDSFMYLTSVPWTVVLLYLGSKTSLAQFLREMCMCVPWFLAVIKKYVLDLNKTGVFTISELSVFDSPVMLDIYIYEIQSYYSFETNAYFQSFCWDFLSSSWRMALKKKKVLVRVYRSGTPVETHREISPT